MINQEIFFYSTLCGFAFLIGFGVLSLYFKTLSISYSRGKLEISLSDTESRVKSLSKEIDRLREIAYSTTAGDEAVLAAEDEESKVFKSFKSVALNTTGTNLLRNSSFEAESNGKPSQWDYQLESTSSNTGRSAEGIRSGEWGGKV